jgi:Flp pilus assembly protein TadG
MNLHSNQRGQMLVTTAIELTLLLGFLALATDVGVLFHSKRQMQIAADAAATAAAMNELDDMATGSVLDSQTVAAARDAAAANGFTNGQSGVVVTVNIGRRGQITDGYHTGAGYVEAIVSKPDPLYFFKFFTGNNTATVAARAVAGSPGASENCNHLNNPTGDNFQLQGNDVINTPGCSWYDNSDGSATGFTMSQTGGAATLNAPYVSSVGPAGTTSLGGAPVFSGALPAPQPPLQSVGATPPGDCTATYTTFPTPGTLLDGNNGVVCFTGKNVDISGQQLSNGVFLFENGVVVGNSAGNTTLTNATLDVYGGTFTQNSNSNLNITAPASLSETFGGLAYNAVALLVPAENTTYTGALCQQVLHGNQANNGALTVQIGNSGQRLDGYIVAPNAALFLNDHGGGITASGLDVGCLYDKSSTITINSYNLAHPNTTPLRYVALVE